MTSPMSQSLAVRFVADFGNLNRGLDGVQGRFRAVAGGIKGIAAAGAALGAVSFLKGAIEEAREAAKVGKQTEAVLKSTGGAANVSAGQISKLAERLSNLAGVDDEVIQGNANLLLTFTKVRNEVGKGNNIFDQGTEAALNMSAAMGTDMKSSTIMLGKALNDPIKGITAMNRAGVQFTQQQKDQIKTMVKSGDTLGAQKIILKELNTQFGGMAAASADAGMKAKVSFDNMKEALGERLLPVFNQVADFLTRTVIPVVSNLAQRLGAWLAPMVQKVSEYLTTRLVPAIKSVMEWIQTRLWPVVQKIFNMIIPIITPVVAVVIRLAEVAFRRLFEILTDRVLPAIKAIVDWLDRNRIIVAIVMGAVIALTASMVTMRVVSLATAAALRVVAIAQGILNAVMRANPFAIVITIIGALVGAFIHLWNTSVTFRNIVTGVWNAVKNTISWVWENVIKRVFNAFKSTYEAIGRGFSNFVDGVSRAWNKIKKIMAAPINFVIKYVYNNGIRWAWNKVADVVGFGKLPEGREIKFSRGGVVPGYGPANDKVHAALSPGEGVLVPELTRAIGPRNIMQANRYARSGRLGGPAGRRGRGGDSGVWRSMKKIADNIPGASVSSAYRPGDSGWHGSGNAIDIVGPLRSIAVFLARRFPQSTQIIYGGMGGPGNPFPNVFHGRPHWYRSDAADHLDHVHWAMANTEMFSGSARVQGGGIGALLDWIGGAAKTTIEALTNPVQFIRNKLGQGTKWVQAAAKFPVKIVKSGVDWLWDKITSFESENPNVRGGRHHGGAKVGSNVLRWSSTVLQALTQLRQPHSLLSKVLRRMDQESGGNPNAVNNWDINARRGTPSKGLMQVIQPTFDRWAGPYKNYPIMHPLANIYAGLNYALNRYGSIATAMDKPGGYRNGGWLMPGGLAYNETSKPEAIFNQDQLKSGMGEKHYHMHLNVSNQPVDLVQQFMRMELLEPPR